MIDFEKLSLQQLEVLREQWYTKAAKDGIVEAVIQVFLMFGKHLSTNGIDHETVMEFKVGEFKMVGDVYNVCNDPILLKPKKLIKLQAYYRKSLVFDTEQRIFVPKQEWVNIIQEYALKIDKITSPLKEEKDKKRREYLLKILEESNE